MENNKFEEVDKEKIIDRDELIDTLKIVSKHNNIDRKETIEDTEEDIKKYVLVSSIGLAGFLVLIICIVAGSEMLSIQSIAGNTIDEAFYNAFGIFVIGCGIFFNFILWGIAYLILIKK